MRTPLVHMPAAILTAILSLFVSTQVLADCQPSDDVLASLRCLEGVTVEEGTTTLPGYRQFEIKFTQPANHSEPNGAALQQRIVLLHRSFNEPMVLQTSGYSIFGVSLSRLAKTFATNQLQVEHRFFSGSTPTDADWSDLDIEQSAADFHRITVAFKQLYGKRWVGTGASKGGMTSVYHRRFYPSDLDGTVADVAPLSFSKDDQRYVTFVNNVGGPSLQACRAKLEAAQVAILARRAELLPLIEGTFTRLGSAEVALEHAVVELPFAFWQYGTPTDPNTGCARIPNASSTTQQLFAYLSAVSDVSGYGDDGFAIFQSYYFQAGTQLGGPGAKLNHLSGRRLHDYSLDQYMPEGGPYTYSNSAMHDVANWVRDEASGIMFVYGEYDPWTAGAFPTVVGRDMHTYRVPGGNHGAKFSDLAAADKQAAIATLSRWLDRPAVPVEAEDATPTLDDLESAAKRQYRLP